MHRLYQVNGRSATAAEYGEAVAGLVADLQDRLERAERFPFSHVTIACPRCGRTFTVRVGCSVGTSTPDPNVTRMELSMTGSNEHRCDNA